MGSPEAQTNLANLYDAGDGVKENFDTARYWYKRAIARGSPDAAFNLGISYLNRGNTRWAVYWLSAAKAQGEVFAIEKLEELGLM
jgi:TPR repeat protein